MTVPKRQTNRVRAAASVSCPASPKQMVVVQHAEVGRIKKQSNTLSQISQVILKI
jgi:hypothetical protein